MQKIYFIALFLTFYFISAYSTDIEGPAPPAGQTSRQRGAYLGAPVNPHFEMPKSGSIENKERSLAKPKKLPRAVVEFNKKSANTFRLAPGGFRGTSATAWRPEQKSFRNRYYFNNRRGYRSNQIRRFKGRIARRYASGGFRGTSATAGRRARKYYRNIRRRYNNSRRKSYNQRRNYKRRRNMRRNSNRNSRNSERVVKKKVFTLIKVAKEYKEILSEISSDKKLLKKKLEDIIDRYMDF